MTVDTIAERVLTSAEDPKQKVTVRLGKPRLNKKTKDYRCVYQITGKDVNRTRFAAGLDGFQALQLALLMIAAEIASIEKVSGVHLTFSDLGNSGFPLTDAKK